MVHKTLYDSPRYKTFIEERNRALEVIESHAQLDLSRILFEALSNITGYVSHMAISKQMSIQNIKYLSKQLDDYLSQQFEITSQAYQSRIMRLRRRTFVLSFLGELEAIARATKRTCPVSIHEFKTKLDAQQKKDTIHDSSWHVRLFINFHKLKQKILMAFQRAIAVENTPLEVVQAVQKSYPQAVSYKRPTRALKPLREAEKKSESGGVQDGDDEDEKEFDFYHGLTNDDDWKLTVDAYKDTELPASRFDNLAQFNPDTGTMQYNWEVEQEVTDDFVDQVRDGQVEAANDLGIQDFVWVAIIDKKTCEVCCLPRAGKLVSEIESMLASGELDKDECDATTPPAHPFDRCDLAPVASTDEVEGPDWKSFGDWLNS